MPKELSKVIIVCVDSPIRSLLILIYHHALSQQRADAFGTDVMHVMLFQCVWCESFREFVGEPQ